MARKKIERQEMNQFHNFEKEKLCRGMVQGLREIQTKFGPGNVIDLVTQEGEKISVMQTAGLKGYEWGSLEGQTVEIESTGYTKTVNGVMMAFDVFVIE